jgi:hypothetical protein
MLVLACAACWTAGCGKGGGAQPAVRIGGNVVITKATVDHWLSALIARGGNGREPGPPTPAPPDYKACIAYERVYHSYGLPPNANPKQRKAYCELQHRRYTLKALYLLISYHWVVGQAAELGLRLDRAQLAQELSTFKRALNVSTPAAYARYLRFERATPQDVALSFELEQLEREIEAKVTGPAGVQSPQGRQALTRFGEAFKRRWLARTSCQPGYVVPICREYNPPSRPPEFTPPALPLSAAR